MDKHIVDSREVYHVLHSHRNQRYKTHSDPLLCGDHSPINQQKIFLLSSPIRHARK